MRVVGYVRDPLVQLLNIPNISDLRSSYYLTRHSGMVRELCNPYAWGAGLTLPTSLRSSIVGTSGDPSTADPRCN